MRTTKIETLASLRARQAIITDFFTQSTEGIEEHDLVEVTSDVQPWGTFLIGFKKATKCEGNCGLTRPTTDFSEDPEHTMCDDDFAEYTAHLDETDPEAIEANFQAECDDAESLLEGPDFDALIDQIRVTNQVRKAARS